MSELKRILSLGLMSSIVGLAAIHPLAAADPRPEKANWDNLKQLVPGQQIEIVLNDAKSYQGKFESVSDDSVVLRLATGEQTFTGRVSCGFRPKADRIVGGTRQ